LLAVILQRQKEQTTLLETQDEQNNKHYLITTKTITIMKTKKNLVKSMLVSILTAGVTNFCFTACSDEMSDLNDTCMEVLATADMANLEQYSYTVPVEIQSEGAWKIDIKFKDDNRHFCYVLPAEGFGPQTATLCILDNWTDERNAAELCITDMQNPDASKTIYLGQKCNLDNVGMTRAEGAANSAPKGDIIYGVGYGYNICRQPGQKSVMRSPIIAIEKLKAEGNGAGRYVNGVAAQIKMTTHTGNSVEEIARKMETSSSLKGSYVGFKAEIGASFSKEDLQKTTNRFALGTADVTLTEAYLGGLNDFNVRNYLTDDARRAIDDDGSLDAGNFLKLVRSYGTHLLVKAPLGGRLRYATTVDMKYVKDDQDLKVWANANYKNLFVEADAQFTAEEKQSHEMTDEKGSIRVSAEGGTFEGVLSISGIGKDNDENMRTWLQSLADPENMVVVGANGNSGMEMMPIWELVDDKYPERQKMLREYIESGQAERDLNTETTIVEAGEMARFNIPTFSSASDATLVKEVMSKKKVVAMICSEYLPQFDPEERVTVIYPVEGGQPTYSSGLFIGNADYAPHYISWNEDGTINTRSISDAKKGMLTTAYVRDGSIYTGEYHAAMVAGSEILDGQVVDKYMTGEKYVDNGALPTPDYMNMDNGKTFASYKYPVVKIATNLWTRENYGGCIKGDCHKHYTGSGSYYTDLQAKNQNNIPAGWRIAASKDYQTVKNLLSADHYATPAKRLFDDRLSGYNAAEILWCGWNGNTGYVDAVKGQAEYMTSDGHHVSVKTDGTFDIVKWGEHVTKMMVVRLVAE